MEMINSLSFFSLFSSPVQKEQETGAEIARIRTGEVNIEREAAHHLAPAPDGTTAAGPARQGTIVYVGTLDYSMGLDILISKLAQALTILHDPKGLFFKICQKVARLNDFPSESRGRNFPTE
jgi:hypothetical protein